MTCPNCARGVRWWAPRSLRLCCSCCSSCTRRAAGTPVRVPARVRRATRVLAVAPLLLPLHSHTRVLIGAKLCFLFYGLFICFIFKPFHTQVYENSKVLLNSQWSLNAVSNNQQMITSNCTKVFVWSLKIAILRSLEQRICFTYISLYTNITPKISTMMSWWWWYWYQYIKKNVHSHTMLKLITYLLY